MGSEEALIPENMKASADGIARLSVSSEPRLKCMADFKVVKEIGEGSFSTVYLATEKTEPCRQVAIKTCFKKQIIKEKRVDSVHREKQVLAKLALEENLNPFILLLYATFQDAEHLYFVTSYAKYGDLLRVMATMPEQLCDLPAAKFYAAELLSALQHLHKLSIIHRDVKPENILVAESGHILLSDFGSVKDLKAPVTSKQPQGRIRRSSFVGTAQYVSPEVLAGETQSPSTDLWAFGVVVFQLLTGRHCFHDESEYLIFKRIQKLLFKFPEEFPPEAKDLVDRLLVIEPDGRLGSDGNDEILRQHPFFAGIDWKNLENAVPPFPK